MTSPPSELSNVSFSLALTVSVDGNARVIGDLRDITAAAGAIGEVSGRVVLVIDEDFRSYLKLELTATFTDKNNGKVKKLPISLSFDNLTNILGDVQLENCAQMPEELQPRLGAMRTQDGNFWKITFDYNGRIWAKGVFGLQDLNECEPLLEELRKLFQEAGSISFFVHGAMVELLAGQFTAALASQKRKHPLKPFFSESAQKEQSPPPFNVETVADTKDRPKVVADAYITFPDKVAYAVQHGLSVIQEQEFDRGEHEMLIETLKKIPVKMLSLADDSDDKKKKNFVCFLDCQYGENELREDQVLYLIFCETSSIFECTVQPISSDVSGRPAGYLLRAKIPDGANRELKLNRNGPKSSGGTQRVPTGIDHLVDLRINLLDMDTKRQMDALRSLQDGTSRNADAFAILLGNNLRNVARMDFYERVPGNAEEKNMFLDTFLDTIEQPFNERQKSAFRSLRSIPRIHMIQGPGGTGKSEFATLACQPLILTRDDEGNKNQILIACGSNVNVDDLATQALEHTRMFLPSDREAIVIRLHTYDTELAVFTGKTDWKKTLRSTSTSFDDEVVAAISQAYDFSNLAEVLLESAEPIDRRLQLESQSLGYVMRRIIGVYGDDDPLYDADRFVSLRTMYRNWTEGLLVTRKDKSCFLEEITLLTTHVLREADIIVTTISNAANPILRKDFQPCVIIVDEAGRLTEGAIWPLFANYGRVPMVFLGDCKQTGPVVRASPAANGFCAQLELPFFTRMLTAGAPVTIFNHQHRYPTEVCTILSKHFYEDELESSPEVDCRPYIAKLRQFNKDNLGIENLMMFVDTPNSRCETSGKSKSKMSTVQLAIVLDVVDKLLSSGIPATAIGIASPYTMMNRFMTAGLNWLTRQHHTQARKVLACTIDGFTGLERDIMLIPLVVSGGLGFLRQTSRICTALTRCRVGFTLVGNLNAMSSSREWRGSAIGEVVQDMVKRGMYTTTGLERAPKEYEVFLPKAKDLKDSSGRGDVNCCRCGGTGHVRADCTGDL